MRAVLVELVDDPVVIAVDELAFQRLAISVVLLLVDEEGTWSVAYGVDLHVSTRTTSDTTCGHTLIARDLDGVELGDLGAVGADVVAHIPREMLGLDRCSVDAQFEALAGDVPYVRQDTI